MMSPKQQQIAIAEACGWAVFATTRSSDLPDYLNDLNAMHEAEKALTETQHRIFYTNLILQFPYPKEHWFISATASQRAEALLKTLNLWKDESLQ